MAIQPTYPGVYVQEISSGVRTISGTSTSITAFVGTAKRGPIEDPTRIDSFGAFERIFGGLDESSEMSFAVRQFYSNGGKDAIIVRLAKNALEAVQTLENSNTDDVLQLTALHKGTTGNYIQVVVSPSSANPVSRFDLTLAREIASDPSGNVVETFNNLSMDSDDARYVLDIVNGDSTLVTVERLVSQVDLDALPQGTSLSAPIVDDSNALLDVGTLVDDRHNQLQVTVNGSTPVTVIIAAPTGADAAARLANLCSQIQTQVQAAANGNSALASFTCAVQNSDQILMTSGEGGEHSHVHVSRGARNDLSKPLNLGAAYGGTETDGVAGIMPKPIPEAGTLVTDTIGNADIDALTPTANKFKISLDGSAAQTISIPSAAIAAGTIAERLAILAPRIQDAVRAAKPADTAFSNFSASVEGTNRLRLASGSAGTGSSVAVFAADSESLADELGMLTGITTTNPTDVTLEGGNEEPFTDDEAYGIYVGSQNDREGIYALEDVDLFNMLVLAGVTDVGILSDAIAYCQDRRAFLIADLPSGLNVSQAQSALADMPKSNYGAAYYPWIHVANPLKGGKLRACPPSGTMAGVYARTDSNRGVWVAPAGTDAALMGVQQLGYKLTDSENGVLNPLGLNCLRTFPAAGRVAWGARTLRGDDGLADEYKYVPVRRLALMIEESLYRGTQWVVFEPNDENLWAQIRLNLTAYMHGLFRQGAFQGTAREEAYLVKCDSETTTQADIDKGIVNILVGFAPLKPAEFVIIQIQQLTGQSA